MQGQPQISHWSASVFPSRQLTLIPLGKCSVPAIQFPLSVDLAISFNPEKPLSGDEVGRKGRAPQLVVVLFFEIHRQLKQRWRNKSFQWKCQHFSFNSSWGAISWGNVTVNQSCWEEIILIETSSNFTNIRSIDHRLYFLKVKLMENSHEKSVFLPTRELNELSSQCFPSWDVENWGKN